MTEDLFWVWRDGGDTGVGYRVVSSDKTPRRVTSMKPCLEAATYEVLANFFLQEGRNAAIWASGVNVEGYKPKVAVQMTDDQPSGDIEHELMKRMYRRYRG